MCGQQPLRGPSRSSRQRAAEGFLRRARFFGTHAPRDKERERTSRKIGRESTTPSYGADLSMPHLGDDPVAPPRPQQRPHRRSLRSPELQRRPEPEYHQKGIGAAGDITIVRPAAAAPPRRPEQVELRRARVFGDHPPRDKEHHLASRKCRRESTPQNPMALIFRCRTLAMTP